MYTDYAFESKAQIAQLQGLSCFCFLLAKLSGRPQESRFRFRIQVRIQGKLQHRHILRLLSCFEDEWRPIARQACLAVDPTGKVKPSPCSWCSFMSECFFEGTPQKWLVFLLVSQSSHEKGVQPENDSHILGFPWKTIEHE